MRRDAEDTGQGGGRNRNEIYPQVEALALALGNVSEACRRCGVARRTFYAWKKETTSSPAAGANRAERIRRPHPHAVSDQRVQEVIAIALEYPEWGCDRIAHFLKLKGRKLSSPTVQKILIRNGLGRASQRRARREEGS